MVKTIFFIMDNQAIGSPVLGIVIPSVIFVISIVATLLLYRHFSRRS